MKGGKRVGTNLEGEVVGGGFVIDVPAILRISLVSRMQARAAALDSHSTLDCPDRIPRRIREARDLSSKSSAHPAPGVVKGTHDPGLPSQRTGDSLERLSRLVEVEDLYLSLGGADDHERVDDVEGCEWRICESEKRNGGEGRTVTPLGQLDGRDGIGCSQVPVFERLRAV